MIYHYRIKKKKLVANTKPAFFKGAFAFTYLAGGRPPLQKKKKNGSRPAG